MPFLSHHETWGIFDPVLIRNKIPQEILPPLFKIEIADCLSSTNTALLNYAKEGEEATILLIAREQTQGRGQYGRSWVSSQGGSLTFSLLITFSQPLQQTMVVATWVGKALLRSLERLGIQGAYLKWPNDILWENKKLAGVLVEMYSGKVGFYSLIIGVGMNVKLPLEVSSQIHQPWIDIYHILGNLPPANDMLAFLLEELLRLFPISPK